MNKMIRIQMSKQCHNDGVNIEKLSQCLQHVCAIFADEQCDSNEHFQRSPLSKIIKIDS